MYKADIGLKPAWHVVLILRRSRRCTCMGKPLNCIDFFENFTKTLPCLYSRLPSLAPLCFVCHLSTVVFSRVARSLHESREGEREKGKEERRGVEIASKSSCTLQFFVFQQCQVILCMQILPEYISIPVWSSPENFRRFGSVKLKALAIWTPLISYCCAASTWIKRRRERKRRERKRGEG